jgi:uncharacterized membrane protein
VRVAYDQWTQLEEFPRFMQGVEQVSQVRDALLHWKVKVAGVEREFDAVVTEQVPDQVISWSSVDGPRQAGTVTFQPLPGDRTQVTLSMAFEPDGPLESAGDALGLVERRVRGDLERFKDFVESRGLPTGGWRGQVHGGVAEA